MGDYTINVHLSGDKNLLGSQNKLMIYRIIQEALSNIIMHDQGNQIDIFGEMFSKLVSSARKGLESVRRKDLSENEGRSGSGMYNIMCRTRLIGGTFSYDCKTGEGPVLMVVLPFNAST